MRGSGNIDKVNYYGGCDMLELVINGFHIAFGLVLISSILMQSGKSAGLSGSIAGGSETFFGKNKGKTYDSLFSKVTMICAILFLITSITLTIYKT
jgi:preprotein translocase subunit SecG